MIVSDHAATFKSFFFWAKYVKVYIINRIIQMGSSLRHKRCLKAKLLNPSVTAKCNIETVKTVQWHLFL